MYVYMYKCRLFLYTQCYLIAFKIFIKDVYKTNVEIKCHTQ